MLKFYPDNNLDFIKQKINEIKIALFKSELSPELQLPNNIIKTLKVEDDGAIWFYTSSNGNHVKNINGSFYAYLDFQKKGGNYRLQVSGKAGIVKDDDEGLYSISNYAKGSYGKLVLIRMKIMQAEFFENKPADNIPWGEKIKKTVAHFFMAPLHRTFNFTEHT
jgi:hypothetical protein